MWQRKGVRVTTLFILWVFFTGTAALYSKAFLKITPMPYLLTMAQGFVGLIFNYLYLAYTQGSVSPLKGNRMDVIIVLFTHLIGTTMTNIATVKSEASFVNTLKAAEPLCAVGLAKYVLHQEMTSLTYISLIIIVFGIILACTTEFQFYWSGFLNAMGSNAFFTSRAVFTKKLITKDKNLNSQTIFLYISGFTCLCTTLPALYEVYSINIVPTLEQAAIVESVTVDQNTFGWPAFWVMLKAVFSHYMYNILSFFLVVEVDALTYSVGNSVKRLVTIYSAILYFNNPVTSLNMIASVVAVLGVFLYSYDREKVRNSVDVKKQQGSYVV